MSEPDTRAMSRWQAAKATAKVTAVCYLLALALDRWPNATVGEIGMASVYQAFRKGPSDGV